MPLEGADFLAGGDIPECDRPVITARSQDFTIRTKTDTPKHIARSSESTDFLAGGNIPDCDDVK